MNLFTQQSLLLMLSHILLLKQSAGFLPRQYIHLRMMGCGASSSLPSNVAHRPNENNPSTQADEQNTNSANVMHHKRKERQDDKQWAQKKKKRPYRPGFNSYLKVNLEDDFVGRLYAMALDVQTAVAREQEQSQGDILNTINHSDTTAGENLTIDGDDAQQSKPQQQRQRRAVRFKPRSQQSLHMTLFFGGEVLCELPANELQEWYNRISLCIQKSGFCLHSRDDGNDLDSDEAQNDGSSKELQNDFSFTLSGLTVFPPQRKNLVVASLNPSPSWFRLHDEIHAISHDESVSKALAEATQQTAKGKWKCHITLGNFMGGNKKDYPRFQSLLDKIFKEHTISLSDNLQTRPLSISMGGPTPEQIPDLEWTFEHSSKTTKPAINS